MAEPVALAQHHDSACLLDDEEELREAGGGGDVDRVFEGPDLLQGDAPPGLRDLPAAEPLVPSPLPAPHDCRAISASAVAINRPGPCRPWEKRYLLAFLGSLTSTTSPAPLTVTFWTSGLIVAANDPAGLAPPGVSSLTSPVEPIE